MYFLCAGEIVLHEGYKNSAPLFCVTVVGFKNQSQKWLKKN